MLFIEILFKLLCGHAVADFCLQTDWIANNKNRHSIPKGYDPDKHGPQQTIWPYVLSAHALTHGLATYLATGNIWFGMAETVAHWLIDFGKCERMYGIHTDQWLHIGCKVIWTLAYTSNWL